MSGKFFYFAYGSNLWSKRIHINNPSAVRVGIGKLKVRKIMQKQTIKVYLDYQDYKLDFVTYSKRWRGASATIIPYKGNHVWGALWELDKVDLPNLDR